MYLNEFTQPIRTKRIRHKVNFPKDFNRFEFRLFKLGMAVGLGGVYVSTQPFYTNRVWHKVSFLGGVKKSEFRVFFLLNRLLCQS